MRLNFIPNLIGILLILSIPNLLFTQKDKPFKWGDIPPEDLAMTVYDKDTSAAAVVLMNYGYIQIEPVEGWWRTRTEIYRRIKILKPAGLVYGDIAITPRHGVKLDEIRAQVTNPDGTTILLKIKDLIREKTINKRTTTKFAFPNLKIGSVIEYKFEKLTKNITSIPPWYFHSEIPVRHSELRTTFPRDFEYSSLVGLAYEMNLVKNGKTNIYKGQGSEFRVSDSRFILKNGNAISREPHITCTDDYKAKVWFQLDASSNYWTGYKEFFSSWEELADDIYNDITFGVQYKRREHFKNILDIVTPNLDALSTDTEKAQYIHNFVLNEIEWDDYYTWWVSNNEKQKFDDDNDLNKIFKRKKGTSGEINMMQLALLRSQSIEALPMLISTRSNGKMYESYPLIKQFNHLMVYAKLDGKEVFIDVPSENRSIFEPMKESLNKRGAVMFPKSVQWVDVKAPFGSDTFAYDVSLNEEGTLNGELKCSFKGYYAIPEKEEYRKDDSGKHWVERFNENYPDAEIKAGDFENLDNPDKPFKEKLHLTIPEAAQVSGDFIYFSPILYSNFSENIFDLEKRLFPVDFAHPFGERFFINLKIPDGYAVEELPQSANFALANKSGSFRYVVEQKDEQHLQIVIDLKIKQLQFLPAEYPHLRDLFIAIEEKFGEQIVLKKK